MANNNNLNSIKLSKGLIAIGGNRGEGKTTFILKQANNIAKNENVLFVTYEDYPGTLKRLIGEKEVNKNLKFDNLLEYYENSMTIELIKQIEQNSISTVIIDSINYFTLENDNINYAIADLKHIAKMLDIRILFTVNIVKTDIETSRNRPQIRDFKSRRLVNECGEIYAIYRPKYYGFEEDSEGNKYSDDYMELYSLKNSNNIQKEIDI